MSLLESSAISLKSAVKSTAPEQASVSTSSSETELQTSEKPFNEHLQQEIENQVKPEPEAVVAESVQTDEQIAVIQTELSIEEVMVADDVSEKPVAETTGLLTGNNLPVIEAELRPVKQLVSETVAQIAVETRPETLVPVSNLSKTLSQPLRTENVPETESSKSVEQSVIDLESADLPEELNSQLPTKQKPQFEAQITAKSEFTELVKATRGTIAQHSVPVSTDATTKTSVTETVTQQFQLNTPLQQKQWGNEFTQRISMMISNGQKQVAEMRLNPARLGSIGVRIQIEDDKANISFLTSHQSVKEAIEVSLPRLKDQLEQQGLDLGDVDVSARDSEQTAEDSEDEFNKFQNDFNQLNSEKNENTEMHDALVNFEKSDGVSVFV